MHAKLSFSLSFVRDSDKRLVGSQPTLPPVESFKIRRATFPNFTKFANLLIARLLNIESDGRVD